MIFVTVGSHSPFDRLVRIVETWAIENGCANEVFYQIGNGIPPSSGQWKRSIPSDEYRRLCKEAGLIVSHAGTGIWMTAAETGKPLILFPRRFAVLHEAFNEHQYDMCLRVASEEAVTIAYTEEELRTYLDAPNLVRVPSSQGVKADELNNALRQALAGKPLPPAQERRFDGIVCFGGLDYCDLNRENDDIHILEELSRNVPVLYINTICMRTLGVNNGKKQIQQKFKGRSLGRRFSVWQARRAMRKMGIRNPLLWIACPTAMPYIDYLKFDSFVYHRSDRMKLFANLPAV